MGQQNQNEETIFAERLLLTQWDIDRNNPFHEAAYQFREQAIHTVDVMHSLRRQRPEISAAQKEVISAAIASMLATKALVTQALTGY